MSQEIYNPLSFVEGQGLVREIRYQAAEEYSLSWQGMWAKFFSNFYQTRIPEVTDWVCSQMECFGEPFETTGDIVVIGGSTAKKIIGGEPVGWDMPGRIWQRLVKHEPSLLRQMVTWPLCRGGQNNLNLKIVATSQGWDECLQAISLGSQSQLRGVEWRSDFHPDESMRTMRLEIEGFQLDLGPIASDGSWDGTWNCRTYMGMPVSEAYSVVTRSLGSNPELHWNSYDENLFWGFDRLAISGHLTGLTQAVIGTLRSLRHGFWWPPKYRLSQYSLWNVLEDEKWWQEKLKQIPVDVALGGREAEITTDLCLLLTCNPHMLNLLHRYHILDILTGGDYLKQIKLSFSAGEYHQKFVRGEIGPGESGIEIIASQLGLHSIEALLHLLTPNLNYPNPPKRLEFVRSCYGFK